MLVVHDMTGEIYGCRDGPVVSHNQLKVLTCHCLLIILLVFMLAYSCLARVLHRRLRISKN